MPPEFNSIKVPVEKEDSDSALKGFGKSLINSAIQNPLNSLSQIGSSISGVHLPELHYFDPSAPTDGTQKFAQQAGKRRGHARSVHARAEGGRFQHFQAKYRNDGIRSIERWRASCYRRGDGVRIDSV